MDKKLQDLLAAIKLTLETAADNACSCCNSSDSVRSHCQTSVDAINTYLAEINKEVSTNE